MIKEKRKTAGGLWNFVDNLQGDKVVWMIVLMLILISIVAVFSSTPLLAIQNKTSRISIVSEQLLVAAGGIAVIIGLYNIKSIRFYRLVSQLGFIVSLSMLLFLALHLNFGIVKAIQLNSAWRVIKVPGIQIHVVEVVKVAMVMYLAWAVNAYKNDSFGIANALAKTKTFAFMEKPISKRMMYIYMPIGLICLLIMPGGTSSAIFVGGIMLLTVLIGGIPWKDVLFAIPVILVLGIGCLVANKASGNKLFPHFDSSMKRITENTNYHLNRLKTLPRGSVEFQKSMDKVKQPVSAKIAIHEGGIFGKGPGKSSQRYVVPVMFEDYMYSFIIEEYGLVGGILIIILYGSLLARGSLITRMCENLFAKTAVEGLVILVVGQAAMHIVINLDVGILTGQTLPLISHGNSSFLSFCIAFGVILAISRMANQKMRLVSEHIDMESEGDVNTISAEMGGEKALNSLQAPSLDEKEWRKNDKE